MKPQATLDYLSAAPALQEDRCQPRARTTGLPERNTKLPAAPTPQPATISQAFTSTKNSIRSYGLFCAGSGAWHVCCPPFSVYSAAPRLLHLLYEAYCRCACACRRPNNWQLGVAGSPVALVPVPGANSAVSRLARFVVILTVGVVDDGGVGEAESTRLIALARLLQLQPIAPLSAVCVTER